MDTVAHLHVLGFASVEVDDDLLQLQYCVLAIRRLRRACPHRLPNAYPFTGTMDGPGWLHHKWDCGCGVEK